jgi:hypothetical protein
VAAMEATQGNEPGEADPTSCVAGPAGEILDAQPHPPDALCCTVTLLPGLVTLVPCFLPGLPRLLPGLLSALDAPAGDGEPALSGAEGLLSVGEMLLGIEQPTASVPKLPSQRSGTRIRHGAHPPVAALIPV